MRYAFVFVLLSACGQAAPIDAPSGGAGAAAGGSQASAGQGGRDPQLGGAGGGAGAASGGEAGREVGGAAGRDAGGATGSGGVAGAGTGGLGGSGGSPPARKLERVLAFEYVDVNPDTGTLRGHNGGGADEQLLAQLATEHGFQVDVVDDGAAFTPENLARYDVIAFCSPHYVDSRLSAESRAAVERFVREGGGWVGWHYGLHIEKGWPFMKVLGGGATALGHVGGEQEASYHVVAREHPVAQGLPPRFDVVDDFVRMSGTPSGSGVTVLATATLTAAPGGEGHPVIWVSEVGEGRAFYSMLGHNAPDFRTPVAQTLLWNALRWASGVDEE